MKVEVLYVAECPSYPAAAKLVRDVLEAEKIAANIEEVLVADEGMARQLKFRGSPTIRINGRDLEIGSQESEDFALCCRLYSGSKQVNVPSRQIVRRAVLEARQGEEQ